MNEYKKLRKYERKDFNIELIIKALYKQGYNIIEDVNAIIDVFDISRGGIGFYCNADLPLNFYFNAEIVFNKREHFKTVLKIIRKDREKTRYNYGCIFVGLAGTLGNMIDRYNRETYESQMLDEDEFKKVINK